MAPDLITVHDIAETPVEKMLDYDYLIIGCPTWNVGQLQEDWDDVYLELDALDLTGKKMAIFGLGDQYGYPDSFCDAIGILGRKFIERGAKLFSFTPTDNLHHRRHCLIGGIIRIDVISYPLIISAVIELLQMTAFRMTYVTIQAVTGSIKFHSGYFNDS